jgi:hypothetical protein
VTPLTFTLTGRRYSANDRLHWARANELKKEWRDLAEVTARSRVGARWSPLERVHVTATLVPANRGRVDPANTSPAVKAAVDGMVRAGLFVDDDAAHLVGPDYRLGEPCRQVRGMWTLRFTVVDLSAGAVAS